MKLLQNGYNQPHPPISTLERLLYTTAPIWAYQKVSCKPVILLRVFCGPSVAGLSGTSNSNSNNSRSCSSTKGSNSSRGSNRTRSRSRSASKTYVVRTQKGRPMCLRIPEHGQQNRGGGLNSITPAGLPRDCRGTDVGLSWPRLPTPRFSK